MEHTNKKYVDIDEDSHCLADDEDDSFSIPSSRKASADFVRSPSDRLKSSKKDADDAHNQSEMKSSRRKLMSVGFSSTSKSKEFSEEKGINGNSRNHRTNKVSHCFDDSGDESLEEKENDRNVGRRSYFDSFNSSNQKNKSPNLSKTSPRKNHKLRLSPKDGIDSKHYSSENHECGKRRHSQNERRNGNDHEESKKRRSHSRENAKSSRSRVGEEESPHGSSKNKRRCIRDDFSDHHEKEHSRSPEKKNSKHDKSDSYVESKRKVFGIRDSPRNKNRSALDSGRSSDRSPDFDCERRSRGRSSGLDDDHGKGVLRHGTDSSDGRSPSKFREVGKRRGRPEEESRSPPHKRRKTRFGHDENQSGSKSVQQSIQNGSRPSSSPSGLRRRSGIPCDAKDEDSNG